MSLGFACESTPQMSFNVFKGKSQEGEVFLCGTALDS